MRISEDLITGAKLLGIALSQNQITQFQTYADFLIEQNVNLNLTSTKALEDIEKLKDSNRDIIYKNGNGSYQ